MYRSGTYGNKGGLQRPIPESEPDGKGKSSTTKWYCLTGPKRSRLAAEHRTALRFSVHQLAESKEWIKLTLAGPRSKKQTEPTRSVQASEKEVTQCTGADLLRRSPDFELAFELMRANSRSSLAVGWICFGAVGTRLRTFSAPLPPLSPTRASNRRGEMVRRPGPRCRDSTSVLTGDVVQRHSSFLRKPTRGGGEVVAKGRDTEGEAQGGQGG